MSWERDPLFAKARLYFEHALSEPRDDPRFGLWCSLGLELLGRAAIASVSPMLLAEPDSNQKNLLHALDRVPTDAPKSLGAARVFALCRVLFEKFSDGDLKVSLALVNRRNEELHSGKSAFDEYPSRLWLTGFYRACDSLTQSIGETLESLLGKDEAKIANQILDDTKSGTKKRVEELVVAHRKSFEQKSPEERAAAAAAAEEIGKKLSHEHHHRVKCPSCGSVATVQGDSFGGGRVTIEDDTIKVQQPVSPRLFECPACGLKLQGYADIDVVNLGGSYTRTLLYTPEDYYGLVDVNTFDPSEIIERHLAEMAAEREFDNE